MFRTDRPSTETQPEASPPRPATVRTSNPVRIGRIGAGRIQVAIRPAIGDAELLALVDRLERLIDAGWETIDVVYDDTITPEELVDLMSDGSAVVLAVGAGGVRTVRRAPETTIERTVA